MDILTLQGTYDLGTLTPLERRAGTPLVLTDEEAKNLEQQVAARSEKLNAPIDANRAAPPSGGDDRPARTATSADTTISGSIPDRATPRSTDASAPRFSSTHQTDASPRSPTRRKRGMRLASSGRRRTRRFAKTIPASKAPTPTTIPSNVRSASDASSASARRRARRSCRPTSTTTFTRSCRRRTPF